MAETPGPPQILVETILNPQFRPTSRLSRDIPQNEINWSTAGFHSLVSLSLVNAHLGKTLSRPELTSSLVVSLSFSFLYILDKGTRLSDRPVLFGYGFWALI